MSYGDFSKPARARVSASHFEFKRMSLTCGGCGWHGLGVDCKVSEMFDNGITECVCPQCHEDIAFTSWPSASEYRAEAPNLSPLERDYLDQCEKASQGQ